MARSYTFPLVVAFLGWWFYRNEHVLRNSIFATPEFPPEYATGKCSAVHAPANSAQPLKFCEDAVFWDLHGADGELRDRHVVLSCDPNRKAWNTVMGPLRDPNPRGALWLYSTSTAKVQQFELDGYPAGHDFHPLGLEIWPSHAGNSSRMYVVNHARSRTVIEQFLVSPSEPARAKWIRTLSHPLFVAPNSVALTSDTSFYVTNDHLMTRRLPAPLGNVLPITESILALPLGWVAHVTVDDATGALSHTIAAAGIPFPNGAALSHSGRMLAVASTTTGRVRFYTRDPATNTLAFRDAVTLPFLPDNINYDDAGALVVAGHPNFPALAKVAANATGARAPSWVVGVRETETASEKFDTRAAVSAASVVKASPGFEIETLYQGDGSVFPSSCTALKDGRTGAVYISGLYAEGFLVCRA